MGAIVVSLELDRRHVVERLVDASVVEPVDVVKRRPLDVLDVAPGFLAVDQFALVVAVERLGHGVVIGVATRTDRGHGAGLAESLGVADREVLPPRSVSKILGVPQRLSASQRAATQKSDVMVFATRKVSTFLECQPTIALENTSMMKAA